VRAAARYLATPWRVARSGACRLYALRCEAQPRTSPKPASVPRLEQRRRRRRAVFGHSSSCDAAQVRNFRTGTYGASSRSRQLTSRPSCTLIVQLAISAMEETNMNPTKRNKPAETQSGVVTGRDGAVDFAAHKEALNLCQIPEILTPRRFRNQLVYDSRCAPRSARAGSGNLDRTISGVSA
jgi:hypothetical protein